MFLNIYNSYTEIFLPQIPQLVAQKSLLHQPVKLEIQSV